jgi:hypothetical protein
MSLLTIYLPEEVLKRLRADARRRKKSLSAYVVELLVGRQERSEWPAGFAELYGSTEGSLPAIDDVSPEAGPEL